jgi:hypothetical protein
VEYVINSQVVLAQKPEGPLSSYLGPFAKALKERGYARHSSSYAACGIGVAPAHDCAMTRAARSNRSSTCSATKAFRPLSGTLAASSGSGTRRTIGSDRIRAVVRHIRLMLADFPGAIRQILAAQLNFR